MRVLGDLTVDGTDLTRLDRKARSLLQLLALTAITVVTALVVLLSLGRGQDLEPIEVEPEDTEPMAEPVACASNA